MPETSRTLTIDELASTSGLPSSTIRFYQQQRLIDPPIRSGRRALYRQEHVDQIARIQELTDRGFSLAAIRQLLQAEAEGQTLTHVLQSQTLEESQQMVEMTWQELAERVLAEGQETTPEQFAKSVRLGIVEPVDDSTVRVHREALTLGQQILALGIPRDEVLDAHLAVRQLTDQIAEILMDMFQGHARPDLPTEGDYERFVVLARRVVDLAILRSLDDVRRTRLGAADS